VAQFAAAIGSPAQNDRAQGFLLKGIEMSTSDTDGPATKWAMTTRSQDRTRGSAALQWKKDVQLQERQSAMAEYEAVRREQVANMARLRELRLARDAADAAAAASKKPAAKTRKPAPVKRKVKRAGR
jgi:hypothetical protein